MDILKYYLFYAIYYISVFFNSWRAYPIAVLGLLLQGLKGVVLWRPCVLGTTRASPVVLWATRAAPMMLGVGERPWGAGDQTGPGLDAPNPAPCPVLVL